MIQTRPTLGVVGSSFAAGFRNDFNINSQTNKEDRENAWPTKVAKSLNFELIDESRSGSSPSRIYRKTMDMILSDQCQVILVELTSIDWYELGSSTDGKVVQIQPADEILINKIMLTEYYNTYLFYTNMLRIVVSLQALAEIKKIPIYFIDVSARIVNPLTIDSFCEKILVRHSNLFDALDDDMILERFNITEQINRSIDYSKFLFDTNLTKAMLLRGASSEHFESPEHIFSSHPSIKGQELISNMIVESLQGKI